MNNDMVSETLRQFFGGYFHQDWDLEAKDWQTAVDNFTVGESSAQLCSQAKEIDELSGAYPEDELLVPTYAVNDGAIHEVAAILRR